jgi:hypothetical protein
MDKGGKKVILGIPWWVFMMILFIFLSGFMAYRAMRAEQKLEQQFIEKEGRIYMERIEAEREERKRQTSV